MGKSSGDALEALVRKSLKAQGMDRAIKQTGPRFAGKVGPKGQARGRLLGKGVLDFTGHHRGRHVTFDAKSTTSKTLPFGERGIRRHQAILCQNAHDEGAIAFFLAEFAALDGGPRYFCVTWPVIADWYRRWQWPRPGEKAVASVPLSAIEGHCIELRRVGTSLDLAGLVEELVKVRAGEG